MDDRILVAMASVAGLAPVILLGLGGLLLLLADAFGQLERGKRVVTIVTILLALASATPFLAWSEGGATGTRLLIGSGTVAIDDFSSLLVAVVLGCAAIASLTGLPLDKQEGISHPAEQQFLLLMATAGAVIMVIAAEFITLFIGLELLSLSLYCMCAAARGVKSGAEAAFKYFLLGCFSSAFFLYGIAILYGVTGTTFIVPLSTVPQTEWATPLMYVAFGFLAIGSAFKVGLVPFHSWVPDVYEGAPTSVTTFMGCVVKVAALAIFMRLVVTVFDVPLETMQPVLWLLSSGSMIIGNVVALRQRSVKRMLAYSSIAHAGYLSMGLVAYQGEPGALASLIFYLAVYAFVTVGAFGVVLALEGAGATKTTDVSRYHGLGYSQPVLAALLSLYLLTLAGLPPGLSGLVGKLYLFGAAVRSDFAGLALIGALSSAVGCYYYLRVIVSMYFIDSVPERAAEAVVPGVVKLALTICGVGVILLGLLPSPLYTRSVRAVAALQSSSVVDYSSGEMRASIRRSGAARP